MPKVLKAPINPQEKAFNPSLANFINGEIEAAFRCKVYLYAAWDQMIKIAKKAGDQSAESSESAANNAFREVACIVDDSLDNAISAAANDAADQMRRALSIDANVTA